MYLFVVQFGAGEDKCPGFPGFETAALLGQEPLFVDIMGLREKKSEMEQNKKRKEGERIK